jgi:tetratricopeptide (TPR) repeat protein
MASQIASRRRRDALVAAGLIALTVAAYGGTFQNGFVNFDDSHYVSGNPFVAQGLTWTSLIYAWTTFDLGNWIPLTWMSLELDAALFGISAQAFHATDLLLHTANVLLYWRWLQRATGAAGRSATAAALFAVHPLHVESVAWIAERKDTLSTLFLLCVLHAYFRYAVRPTLRSYGAVVGFFICGLLSKSMLVTLPILLLLADVWPLRRWEAGDIDGKSSAGKLMREKAPLLVLSLLCGLVTIFAQRSQDSFVGLRIQPLTQRLATVVEGYGWYLAKTFAPTSLCAYVPLSYQSPAVLATLASCAALGLISVSAWRLRRREPAALWGWLWYLISLLPVIGILQVGGQAHADRYSYIPHLGLLVGIVWLAADVLERLPAPRVWQIALSAVAIGCCVRLTQTQVAYWKDEPTLWRHALDVDEANWFAHYKIADQLLAAGEKEQAFAHQIRMIQLWPVSLDVAMNYGQTHQLREEWPQAEAFYRTAREIAPRDPDVLLHLGIACAAQGRRDEAIDLLRECLEKEPRKLQARRLLGQLYAQNGHDAAALAECEEIVRQRPDDPFSRQDLALALTKSSRPAEAIPHLLAAVQLAPSDLELRRLLAALLEQQGDLDGALRQVEAAAQLAPENLQLRERLQALRQRAAAREPRP